MKLHQPFGFLSGVVYMSPEYALARLPQLKKLKLG